MRHFPATLKTLTLISLFVGPLNSYAQQEFSELFKGAPADIAKLAEAYVTPATTGIGIGLNSGWYSTAKAKSALRFDFRVTASAAVVPTADKTFDVTKLGLTTLVPASTNTISSSIAGPDVAGARLRIKSLDPTILPPGYTPPAAREFALPNGLNLNYIPAPQVQFTLGLGAGLEVSGRYSPTINLNDYGKVDLLGVGAKIEILPLLGKATTLIPIDIAIGGGYTELKWNMPLEVGTIPNQKLDVVIKGMTADVIVSKKLSFFTPYVTVGYEKTKSSVKALGDFELEVPVTPETPTGKQIISNPFSIVKDDVNGMKATVGFQLKLSFLKLYGSYTKSKYNYYNAGIGFGIGK